MKQKLLIAVIAIFTISTASAQLRPGLRDENRRIRHGVANGQLTAAEAHRLNAQKRALKMEALRYKMNDGRISPCEKMDLRRDNRRLNRQIFIQKHDRQKRFI